MQISLIFLFKVDLVSTVFRHFCDHVHLFVSVFVKRSFSKLKRDWHFKHLIYSLEIKFIPDPVSIIYLHPSS